MDGPVGLRERKKTATRQALHEAAMRLAVERGLDAVTVEAIADAAGVSRRTFSNYFAGKEDAVLYGGQERMRRLVRRFAARPADEPSWTALRLAFQDVYRETGEPDRAWVQQARLARKHPSVFGRQMAGYAALERELAQQITEREAARTAASRTPAAPAASTGSGADETSVAGAAAAAVEVDGRTMAAAFMGAVRVASERWLDERRPGSFTEIVDQALDQMARPFA